jgi:hypothetical protein
VAGILFLVGLQLIPTRLRKPTIVFFTFMGGLYYVLDFFLPVSRFEKALVGQESFAGNLLNVFGAFAVGLGVISLIGLHLKTVSRQREGWGFSTVLIVSFVLMAVFTLLNAYHPKGVIVPKVPGLQTNITTGDVFTFLFQSGLTALDSAMFALIGFFIISASYRAFRIRNVEASMLMASALIVMLGQVSLGTALTNFIPPQTVWGNLRFENLAQYLLVDINTPALRAVTFGIAVGLLATSLRLWLSLERGVYFDQEA